MTKLVSLGLAENQIADDQQNMLGKIATTGQNGLFRTPRHITKLMVDMTSPTPKDMICDPPCATVGFLIANSSSKAAT